MFCHKCGAQIAEEAIFCHNCGTKVVYDAIDPQRVDPIVIDKEQQQTENSPAGSEPLISKILMLNVTPEHEARVIELVQTLTGLGVEEASALIKESPPVLETTPMTPAQVKDVKKAFVQAGVDAFFVDRYGNIVEATMHGKDVDINAHGKNKDGLQCPNCHSLDLIPITETTTDVSGGGYGVGKGCCGWILFGPFGLLCGLCGSGVRTNTQTSTSWVCKNCGHKFRSQADIEVEGRQRQEAISSIALVSLIAFVLGIAWVSTDTQFFGLSAWVFVLLGLPGALYLLGEILALVSGKSKEYNGWFDMLIETIAEILGEK